jgi:hypothetical protein
MVSAEPGAPHPSKSQSARKLLGVASRRGTIVRFDKAPPWAKIAALLGAYLLVVHLGAALVARHYAGAVLISGTPLLHGFLPSVAELPPLARRDSVWYYSIAAFGFPGPAGTRASFNAAFYPAYGLAMRAVSAATGLGALAAGLWLSASATFASLLVAYAWARDQGHPERYCWAVLTAMLAYPSAYLLISAYAESLFLLFVLLVFWLVHRERHALAACAGFCAGLTRIHAFLLVPVLLAQAVVGSRRGAADWKRALLPAAGATGGVLVVPLYFWVVAGDPFLYLHKKTFFKIRAGMHVWDAVKELALVRLHGDSHWRLPFHGLAVVLWVLQEVIVFAAFGVGLHLLRRRRTVPEALFVLGALALNLVSGSFWGFLRYSLFLFPVQWAAARLSVRPWLWAGAVAISVMLQAAGLLHYVAFARPSP